MRNTDCPAGLEKQGKSAGKSGKDC
jgi:hypothetical protein